MAFAFVFEVVVASALASTVVAVQHQAVPLRQVNNSDKLPGFYGSLSPIPVTRLSRESFGASDDFDEDLLWDGVDFPEERGSLFHSILNRQPLEQDLKRSAGSKNTAERNVHVMGLQNTGTNLLASMLQLNFGKRLNYYDFSFPVGEGQFRRGIWKHANIQAKWNAEPELLQPLIDDEVVPLMMVRSPLSWLQSMRKAPYELMPCVSGGDWLTRPCYHRVPAGYKSKVKGMNFPSLEAVWNSWNRAYANVTEVTGFKHALLIHYEDLVMNPEEVMDRVVQHLGIAKPEGEWKKVSLSAKSHGDSHGRDFAISKIQSKAYLDQYTPTDLFMACNRLSLMLNHKFGYMECFDVLKMGDPFASPEMQERMKTHQAASTAQKASSKPTAVAAVRVAPRPLDPSDASPQAPAMVHANGFTWDIKG